MGKTNKFKYKLSGLLLLLVLPLLLLSPACLERGEKIGVLYVIHGGADTFKPQYMFDAAILQFSFDHNHPVNKLVIWNKENWPMVLDTYVSEFTLKYLKMFDFEYERIGGVDPWTSLSLQQLADMKAALDANPYGITFEVDWAGYQCADHPENYPYPRFIYYGPGDGDNLTYCGEEEQDGAWPDCDPERFNVDGPVERLLKKGVSRIIAVDWMMGGPRYSKSFDVVKMARRVLDEWNVEHDTSIPLLWINDYSNLMERSYPTEPAGWTQSLGAPTADRHVLLNSGPNPVVSDPVVATLFVEAIESAMSPDVSDAETGVIFVDHSLHGDHNQSFDPKINDSLLLHKKIKSLLLDRRPTMHPENIIGSWLGLQEINPENGLLEHTREMRSEVYGNAWLYESDRQLPGEEWGYRAWDGLEYLKNRGVQHIVIINVHLPTSSVLDMVEMHNQIGREIGIKTWVKWGTGDYEKYPVVGHPFADYWGVWANTDCGEWDLDYDQGTSDFTGGATLTGNASGATGIIKWLTGDELYGTLTLKELTGTFQDGETITDDKGGSASARGTATMTSKPECCFEMGGCGDPLRPFPPVRQTPLNKPRSDLDPSLVYDMSDYGHLGYDPTSGPPDPNGPVPDQYTGTWAMFNPPDDDQRVGEMLAGQVLNAAINPLVYITNGEIEGVSAGESVIFEGHAVGGKPGYRYKYQWSIKKEGDSAWSRIGRNTSTFTWTPGSDMVGTFDIRCRITDAHFRSGEMIWEEFVVSAE